ncbi:hypothetical protein GN244_ATG19942 [Phytophthora infestans]|uniref:Uncharacterized protein n=1 Tax=Phytophthora infestans TaxID=4787 RepID=A0A833WCI7_PHYIN|nr:hypothetical protein GN244_ATG19942 [Phytophthora infestans]
MAPSTLALKRRWDFLKPWCQVLQHRISYVWPREEDVWVFQRRRLDVYLPTRHDVTQSFWEEPEPLYSNNQDFQSCFMKVREALALLAAVAHVDQAGWRYLLAEHCDVDLGTEGQEAFEVHLPADFVLYFLRDEKKYPESLKNDIVKFCGVHQREHASSAYLKALKRIASLDKHLASNKPGVDIKIPVRVHFSMTHPASYESLCEDFEPLKQIHCAEKRLQQEWQKYERSRKKRDVEPCNLRCTFVLEPMIASFNDTKITPDLAETMQTLGQDNTWFANVSLWFMNRGLEENEYTSRKAIGQLMSSIFGDTRRSHELASSRYCREADDLPLPLQFGSILLECDGSINPTNFEAMGSALVVNQSTRKFEMLLEMDPDDPTTSRHWWRWLAYALFSKRARACSALESLALSQIGGMSVSDVEAFSAILTSKHPEEELFGLSRGAVEDRDATIKAGTRLHYKLNKRGQPPRGAQHLTFETPITSARIFGDDGSSEWVNVLVPGYGRCYVQRTDLELQDTSPVSAGGVTDLKIDFAQDESISDGLPRFLAAIGYLLKTLTLNIADIEVDVNEIVLNCPNLEELSLCGGHMMDIRLNLSEYRANKQPIPDLTVAWNDVVALANALASVDNPLAKCVRRLRVHQIDQWAAWGIIVADHNNRPAFQAGLRALLDMLAVNKSLEYLDVVVPFGHFIYLDDFRRHHLEPLSRSLALSMDTKIAFLSVVSTCSRPVAPSKPQKRRATRSTRARRPLSELNQNVISTIFAFAAPRVLREVYLRDPPDGRGEEPEILPI